MDDHLRHLATLGLGPEATADQIREAYRDLVKVWHPDRFEHDPRLKHKAQERLKEINEAFERLRHYRPAAATRSEGTQRRAPRAETPSDPAAHEPPKPPPPPPQEPTSFDGTTGGQSANPVGWVLIGLGLVVLFTFVRFLGTMQAPQGTQPSPSRPPIADRPNPTTHESPASAPARPEVNAQRRAPGAARSGSNPASAIASRATPDHRPARKSEPASPQLANRFTLGSTWDEVLRIQGTPDRFTSNSLHYGTSDVFFEAKRVTGWYNGYPKLRVILQPSAPTANLSHFTLNSTWDEVLAVQGSPDRFTGDSLHYGTSDVYFRNGRVINWYNGYPKLRVRLEARRPATTSHFTVGSTLDEVLAVQGTPDRMSQNSLHYGTSDVFFENGRVVSWYNGYPKLKVRLEPAR